MPYDTESKSRNVLVSPLGEEGHEVAKGWTVVILIMILDVDVTAEGGIIKLIATSRGNEGYEEKKSESYTSGTISAFSPFGGWRHHLARWEACHWIRGSRGSPMNPVPLPPPQAGALWMLSHGAMSLQESIERFILPPEQGEVRRSRIGGGERVASQSAECFAYHMALKVNPVTLTSYSSPERAIP